MKIVDGRSLAKKIKNQIQTQVAANDWKPALGILACDPNLETRTYLELKQKVAEELGILVVVQILEKDAVTQSVIEAVQNLSAECDGVIVQLPLPVQIDSNKILKAIPVDKDVDAFHYQGEATTILPPVVGAIDFISSEYEVAWKGKAVVIFGEGRLVGLPMIHYAKSKGAKVTVINVESKVDVNAVTKTADIIVLGVGKQNLLTPDMVKTGVVVFDAGASEEGGVLVGDAHPEVASVSSLFTPVPGGIGPITVAVLFRNLLNLMQSQ